MAEAAHPPIPSPEEFCLKAPLYRWFRIVTPEDQGNTKNLFGFSGPLRLYCPFCKLDQVFRSKERYSDTYYPTAFLITLKCAQNERHEAHFAFMCSGNAICKIGQYPSDYDLIRPSLAEYRPVLTESQAQELAISLNLHAHGVGVGSFVYLRRIFEDQIETAHQREVKQDDWDEDKYRKSRWEEKIDMLSHRLPSFLVENRRVYSIAGDTRAIRR